MQDWVDAINHRLADPFNQLQAAIAAAQDTVLSLDRAKAERRSLLVLAWSFFACVFWLTIAQPLYREAEHTADDFKEKIGHFLNPPMRSSCVQLEYPLLADITSPFGWRQDPINGDRRFHQGIDFGAPLGTPIAAAAPGKVIHAGWQDDGYGYAVLIDHGQNLVTLYGHHGFS
ncbi:MAG: M23 family metallopeptidase [Cyanothece sp. SIO1E1]|nr:M23 family metallopeptidase [Cyanothece sp. SIO1E1]